MRGYAKGLSAVSGRAVCLVLLCVVAVASPAFAAPSAHRHRVAKATPTPQVALTVGDVVVRSWSGDDIPLREQLAWTRRAPTSDDDAEAFAAERAAVRSCQAERYLTSRDNLLDGGARPLRDC